MSKADKPHTRTCKWTYDQVHCKFDTACGHSFCFIDGYNSLGSVGYYFCPYCGKMIKESVLRDGMGPAAGVPGSDGRNKNVGQRK